MGKQKGLEIDSKSVALLWSHSHIWGFLVWHSLRSLGVDFALLTAQEIEKKEIANNIKLLIVPGGSARLKSEALGESGRTNIRNFIKNGGKYLGFCGGCGLALDTDEGLGLCPWGRSSLHDRLLHHISGHLYVDIADNAFAPSIEDKDEALLPVWFPARFAATNIENSPKILSRYITASQDLYMADLSRSFIDEYGHESKVLLGKYLDPQLVGEPVAVHGKYGKGEYVISYAHLETPNSAYANAMYSNILKSFAQVEVVKTKVDNLDLNNFPLEWKDEKLSCCHNKFKELLSLGLELGLFFERTKWLYGWRHGIQGVQFANLRIAFAFLQGQKASVEMCEEWAKIQDEFVELFDLFYEGTRSWMYARRLCQSLPDTISTQLLVDQQNRLFGEAMKMNGICGQLLDMLEQVFVSDGSKGDTLTELSPLRIPNAK